MVEGVIRVAAGVVEVANRVGERELDFGLSFIIIAKYWSFPNLMIKWDRG